VKVRIPPSAARAVAVPALRVLAGSWRMSTLHEERWRVLYEEGRPIVYLLWHEALLPLLWHHRRQGVVIVVSENRDGQYLSDFAQVLGYRSIRGSSSRGAARALLGAVRELQAGGSVAFTPDGPRGPRRELKPGVVAAAQRGAAVIVPVHAGADRAWRLDSWDRFLIPKPGARVTVTYGRPFEVSPGDEGLAAGLSEAGVRLAEIAEAGG
jgi:lysophospholipid acyltransferase (LPLAT)-like uncharacterized protein